MFNLAKSRLPVALEAKFAEFPVALIDTHGKDLTVSGEPSRAGTPAGNGTTNAPAIASTSTPTAPPAKQIALNTKTVRVKATFQASADDLFSLLTDDKRIPLWTRAPAQVCLFLTNFILALSSFWQSTAEVGGDYSLFGGGVKGKYISLSLPREIVQSWALTSPTWPAGKLICRKPPRTTHSFSKISRAHRYTDDDTRTIY